ncbi:hypothetical protein, partial [Ileibacterium valens]|uniref:hypothetical protein n=1 Tax=Ileibacterium valens TaxID=1862668 RepID=UPI00259B4D48
TGTTFSGTARTTGAAGKSRTALPRTTGAANWFCDDFNEFVHASNAQILLAPCQQKAVFSFVNSHSGKDM